MMLSASILTGCSIGDTEFVLELDQVVPVDYVFSINGEECSREEIKVYLCNYQNIYGQEYGVNLWEHDFGELEGIDSLEKYVRDITLYELGTVMCMKQLADKQGVTLTEDELSKVDVITTEYYESLSKEELAYMELDRKELQSVYEKYALAQKLYVTLTQGVNEEVSDDEARVIRIQQIYVKNLADAEIVRAKLAGGEAFDAVASSYNEADIIETTLKRGVYPTEVDTVAFNLDNNEQSDMIITGEGYYFICCINKFEPELTEENKSSIISQRRKEQFEDVFKEFVDTSSFLINEKLWEPSR